MGLLDVITDSMDMGLGVFCQRLSHTFVNAGNKNLAKQQSRNNIDSSINEVASKS